MSVSQHSGAWIGLDIGSVAVKGALLDGSNNILRHIYQRSFGQPVSTTAKVMKDLLAEAGNLKIENIGVTGSAGELIASLLDGTFTNEIVAYSHAVSQKYPHLRTVLEMGGEDSKMLFFKEKDGAVELEDFSMNNLCAAGTGSFLDQQANRIGVKINGEFGQLALKSKHPPRIAGRCSVFAKSDMIHLQQIGSPVHDIVAGLCYAVARTFKSNVGRGKDFKKPVAFFGGVSSNEGVVKAMAEELGISQDELFIPEENAVVGAIGAALAARAQESSQFKFTGLSRLENYDAVKSAIRKSAMAALKGEKNDSHYSINIRSLDGVGARTPCFIGVDIGSLSTNVVAIDEDMNVLSRRYIRTASRPIQAVTRGLLEIGQEIGDKVTVEGVGTTGSGRYMVADFIGADVVRNEITAQATAAIHFHRDVDTIFEIGGQDSKYVSVENGAVVDFEMNKVCAAGTGSFIEEQAEKINLNIEKEFSNTAFAAQTPGKFGDRCTVFIESDLVSNQQKGMSKEDLAAGLAYSIVSNYLNRVVGDRKIGNKILFQGGVAWNKAVVAAFEAITGKEINVPPHHDVTGAIGSAIIALKARKRVMNGAKTRFLGFDLTERKYKISTFECKACDNVCDVSRVKFEDQPAHYYGARCELFEKGAKKKKENTAPDLFAEREEMIFGDYGRAKREINRSKPVVGVPRSLIFYELFPFWKTFLEEIGAEVVLSGKTNQNIISQSLEKVKGETCFPIKILHGHVVDLMKKKVDFILLPSIINMNKKESKLRKSQMCPLVQASPYIIRSAIDLNEANVKVLEPSIYFQRGEKAVTKALEKEFKAKMGISSGRIKKAAAKANIAQDEFYASIKRRGAEAIKQTKDAGQKPVVIISRPYNGCDSGINMDLPRKLREMGKVAVPVDFLDLSENYIAEKYQDMYWRSGQRMLAAADVVRRDPGLDSIFISNFKCGPDSFIEHMLREALGGKPCLQLEVDEHSADAGAVTRLEAFFDSLENVDTVKFVLKTVDKPVNGNGHSGKNGKHMHGVGVKRDLVAGKKTRKMFVPYMCDHVYVLAAAIRASGIDAEVMPMSDQESLDLGMRFSSGKECVPFTLTAGDMVKKIQEPGFDPDGSAFFMPTASGPCRFGLYQRVHRMILDELGYKNVPIFSPDGEVGYGDIGSLASDFTRTIWRGIVAVDILTKLLYETRPYEIEKGEADKAYAECLKKVSRIVETDSSQMYKYMYEVRDTFKAIKVEKTSKPVIGIVGEIYMRSHPFGNGYIINRLEELGGEAWIAPIGEWMLYTTNRFIHHAKTEKKYLDLFKGYMQDIFQRGDERKLYEPFKETLVSGEDPAIVELLRNASPYLHESFEGEAVLSVGKAVDYAGKGLSGVINIMPFSCMPGTVVASLSKKLRDDLNGIPWLNLDFDGVEETNTQTRLEAFMYQAGQFREKTVMSKA